nr:hypothetical protein [Tanacetum cinerariifolium]
MKESSTVHAIQYQTRKRFMFHSGFWCGRIKELGSFRVHVAARRGVAYRDKRANVATSAAATNALITMLKHIREQVTSGVEKLSALITMLSLHSAIVSSCLKSRLLIESQSWDTD